jgi:hypothetical protein
MEMVAERYPDQYSEILQGLHNIGEDVATHYGGVGSLTLESFFLPKKVQQARQKLTTELEAIRANPALDIKEKNARTALALEKAKDKLGESVLRELKDSSFGVQIKGGSRGNKNQALSLLVGSLLAYDNEGDEIPLPILRGFSEGLTPSEYWATAMSARSGLIGTKLATPEAGNIANQIIGALQRLRVVEAKEPKSKAGYPISPTDPNYEGSIIAKDVGTIAKAGDVLTPRLARKIKQIQDVILIHSPITSQAEFGISQEAAGKISGEFPSIGAFSGISAAQSLTEPLSQTAIGSKHVGSRAAPGIESIKQLIEIPANIPEEAAIVENAGRVLKIEDSPIGGKIIYVGGDKYAIAAGLEPTVKVGQQVERGQTISQGVPSPRRLVQLKGIGEGRKDFVDIFSQALREAGIDHNKRNVEYIARGLINHVRITQPFKSWLPGDLVEFSALSRQYAPREGGGAVPPSRAVGQYLEEPVAHLTVGTQLSKKNAKLLDKLGFKEVLVHKEAPPFVPEMRRAMESTMHAPDWLMRMGGYHLQRSMLSALHGGQAPAKPTEPTSVLAQTILQGAPATIKG